MKQASIQMLIKVPDEWKGEEFEHFSTQMIGGLSASGLEVLDFRWSCRDLSGKAQRPRPVLAFSREGV